MFNSFDDAKHYFYLSGLTGQGVLTPEANAYYWGCQEWERDALDAEWDEGYESYIALHF